MNEKNIHTDLTFLSLARKLLEGGDPKMRQDRLEELKELVLPGSRAQRGRYTQLLQEAARAIALEELAGQNISPISRAVFQSLERLEVQADDCRRLGIWEQEDDIEGEDLATVAAHIDSADSPEIIRTATVTALHIIASQDGLLERRLYCAGIQRLLEEKILMEEMLSHPSRALSLWDALRRSPVRALAIPLLWYDEEKERFCSAAPENLVHMNTMEELKDGLAVYESSLRSSQQRDHILCQQELCRCILLQAGAWLMKEGLDQKPLFRSFMRTIREYLWGELDLLKEEDADGDNLIPPLIQRFSAALEERKIPVPPMLSVLLRLCVASAVDYSGPFPAWVLEEGEGQ